MARVHIVTEGLTETNFVNDVLGPYLANKGVYLDAHSVTTRRDRRRNRLFRGGLDNLEHLRKDIRLWLLEASGQKDCWVSTMVDLYGFPYGDEVKWINDFETKVGGLQKASFLEGKLKEDFSGFQRFIPFVQPHEFGALLFVNTYLIHAAFAERYTERTLELLNKNVGKTLPEDINSGLQTTPSKRIINFYPEYGDNKPVWGTLIAGEIGIPEMRKACPHFDGWVLTLESL